MGTTRFDIREVDKCLCELKESINKFKGLAENQSIAYDRYVLNDSYRGLAANAAKAFVSDMESCILNDVLELQETIYKLYIHMYEDFQSYVDSASDARIDVEAIKEVQTDFININAEFEETAKTIESIAREIDHEYGNLACFDVPNFTEARKGFEDLCGDGFSYAYLEKCIDKFVEFDEGETYYANKEGYSERIQDITTRLARVNSILTGEYISKYPFSWNMLVNIWEKEKGTALDIFEGIRKMLTVYLLGSKMRCTATVSDPVNVCNGNYINEQVDATLNGSVKLEFKRFYNALSDRQGTLGIGWTHNYEKHIYKNIENDSLQRILADGSIATYVLENEKEGVYVEKNGEPGTLRRAKALDIFSFDGEGWDGYELTFDSGKIEKYDEEGYLTELGNNKNKNVSLSYKKSEGGIRLLSKVEATNGNSLEFSYYEDEENSGLIKSVTDQVGRSICYTYENRKLVKVVGRDGAVREFTYTEDGRIKDVVNPRGITFLSNEYDSVGRTLKQTFADGTATEFEYNDEQNETIVTEQSGNKVTYVHDDFGRHIQTEYFDGKEQFAYNDKNQKTCYVDKKGNTTRFAYDEKGHLTKMIDALGNVTCITYRADGKPTSVKGTRGGDINIPTECSVMN